MSSTRLWEGSSRASFTSESTPGAASPTLPLAPEYPLPMESFSTFEPISRIASAVSTSRESSVNLYAAPMVCVPST